MPISKIAVLAALTLLCVSPGLRGADTKPSAMPADAKASKTATGPKADEKWLQDADMAGQAEVAAGQLALTKAQRADVKAFAQKMVDAHGAANKELADLATKKGVALPAKKPSDHGLDKKSAADFDAAYLKEQISDHEKAEKLFEKGAASKDADIKAWAEKMLPAIRDHLAEARKLAGEAPKK